MSSNEVSTNEIMEFLQEHMVTKEGLQIELDQRFGNLNTELNQRFNKQKLELLDAMDDKFSDLKGDLTILMRREDKKVSELISLLRDKKVIEPAEADHLLSLQPFPQS